MVNDHDHEAGHDLSVLELYVRPQQEEQMKEFQVGVSWTGASHMPVNPNPSLIPHPQGGRLRGTGCPHAYESRCTGE